MELRESNIPASNFKSGSQSGLVIPAGKKLTIETSPQGDEILDIECPAGKVWTARIIVEIVETNA